MLLVYSESAVVQKGLNVCWLFFLASSDESTISLSHEHSEYTWQSLDQAIEMLDYDRQKRALGYIRDNQLVKDVV